MSAGLCRVGGIVLLACCLVTAAEFMTISRQATAHGRQSGQPPGQQTLIAGYTDSEALALGERIYREGILVNGQPVQAHVQGDIPVTGEMFACVLCHRRSGLGSSEGSVVVLPTNGVNLYRPRLAWDTRRRHSDPQAERAGARAVPAFFLGESLREAYDDRTLAQALRTGIDPSGRVLDPVMPRYRLGATDMAVLIHYLKSLSARISPGVSATSIRFATVVTSGVAEPEREAMLAMLRVHINDSNAQTRNQLQRARAGAFTKREKDAAYRRLELSVWELTGAPHTWREQLEAWYRREPVFALLGGIAAGDWAPIHEFSEQYNIPTILPLTERPLLSGENWNTLYYSRGLSQEGETVARYLRRVRGLGPDAEVIQVYRAQTPGSVVAAGFAKAWAELGGSPPDDRVLSREGQSMRELWQAVMQSRGERVVLFWGTGEDMQVLDTPYLVPREPASLFVSYTLIGEDAGVIPAGAREQVYMSYPYSLPGEKARNLSALRTWLRLKGIAETDSRMQAKMYFLGWMLPRILSGMKSEYYRDYLLETIEMMADQTHAIAAYPRLSFGPGQRYAAKGCYIVQAGQGDDPPLLPRSEWVIH